MKIDREVLKYLLKPYTVINVVVPEEDGGGYVYYIPEFGLYKVCAYGNNRDTAYSNMQHLQKDVISEYLSKNIPIPDCWNKTVALKEIDYNYWLDKLALNSKEYETIEKKMKKIKEISELISEK